MMSNPKITLRVIRAKNLDQTVKFYSDLGFEFKEEQHGNGPIHFAADISGVIFEIYPAKAEEEADKTTRLGFSVGEVEGIEFNESPWGKRAVVKDPDGRSVELYQSEL